jgi:pimeloyl-ACP methyl ester carboxylesterase
VSGAAIERELRLPDGRRLAWAEQGDPDGAPVVACHGNPGSRRSWAPLDPGALRGCRVIAPDRPGFGGSDGGARGHAEWPDDVRALADHLELDSFAVAGVSGGGPYALGCAWRLAGRVSALGLLGTGPVLPEVLRRAGPGVRAFFLAARQAPWLVRWRAGRLAAAARRDPEALVRRTFAAASAADRAVLERPGVTAHLARDFAEAFRRGGRASAAELVLYARPWCVPLAEVAAPTIVWHGAEDTVVDRACGAHLASGLPAAELRIEPGAGHLGYLEHAGDVLRAVVARGARSAPD